MALFRSLCLTEPVFNFSDIASIHEPELLVLLFVIMMDANAICGSKLQSNEISSSTLGRVLASSTRTGSRYFLFLVFSVQTGLSRKRMIYDIPCMELYSSSSTSPTACKTSMSRSRDSELSYNTVRVWKFAHT